MKKPWLFLSAALLLAFSCHKKDGYPVVTTIAGTGVMGSADGSGTAASFSNLMGLAVDSGGTLYVADSRNNLIRKVSTDGAVTTLAGSGSEGSADGKNRSASFFFPGAVAVDGGGKVYVADTHNNLIRKIANGEVTTLAGRLMPGKIAAPESLDRIDDPYGIAVGKNGCIYFADWFKDVIRKISPDGKMTILAGNGTPGSADGVGTAATFYLPEGIAADEHGNLYIADTYNNMIRKINPQGVVTTLAGKKKKGAADGKGAAASFLHPAGIAVDKKGNVYVADMGNNKIRKITPDGTVSTYAGTGVRGSANGPASAATFYKPYGVAVDNSGNVYVADYQNNLIRKISFE